jgi:hypothetical protein
MNNHPGSDGKSLNLPMLVRDISLRINIFYSAIKNAFR